MRLYTYFRSSAAYRLRIALAPEIQAQKVSLQDAPGYVVVRIANLALFAPGSATLKDEFKPIAERLAAALEQEPGTIKIVGHTDSAPISNVRFQSNFQLSQERAKAVAATLKGRMTKPERLEVEGKGADVPVAPNDTAEGRARNRRVEILVPRAQ